MCNERNVQTLFLHVHVDKPAFRPLLLSLPDLQEQIQGWVLSLSPAQVSLHCGSALIHRAWLSQGQSAGISAQSTLQLAVQADGRFFWSVECIYVLHLLKKSLLHCAHYKFWLCIIRTFLPVVPWAAELPGEKWPVVKLVPQAALKRKAEIVVAPGTARKINLGCKDNCTTVFRELYKNVGRDHAADQHCSPFMRQNTKSRNLAETWGHFWRHRVKRHWSSE